MVNNRCDTMVQRGSLTFPIMTLPKPPFAPHSSFATRSSLFGRTVRCTDVTLDPLGLSIVYSSAVNITVDGVEIEADLETIDDAP